MPSTLESGRVVGQAMALSKRVLVDGGLHRQSLEEAMRSLTSGRSPERPLLVTSKEGTTLCFNLDLFLLYSPLLRSLFITSFSYSFLPQSPHLFLPETSLSSLMALESLLRQGVSKAGELDEVLETAAQMGIEIKALVADVNKEATARMEVGRDDVKKTSNARGLLQNDDNEEEVNRVCTDPLPDDVSVGENGIRQKQKSTVDATTGNDVETELLKKAPSPAPISSTAAQQAMDRVMNAGASKASASTLLVDTAVTESPPIVVPTLGGVVSVEVYGAEEEELEREKRSMVEVKSEPVDDPPVQAAAALSENVAAVPLSVNIAVASPASIVSSEKRKESPASALADEAKLKKKKLLDVVLQNLSDKKSGGKGSNNAVKHSKLKRKASDTSSNAVIKAVKEEGDKAVSQQGKRGSVSSTTAEQQAMDRVKNASATKTINSVGKNTPVNIASPTLMSNKGGGATTDASRRKSEPSTNIQASLAAKGKPQALKLSTQGKKKPKKADPSELNSLQSKKVLSAGNSMENLNQMPDLTITLNPDIATQHQPSTDANLPSQPVLSNLALLPEAAVMDLKPSDDGPATFNQTEAANQVGKVEKIPQKVQAGEGEKGCNYSLTCELCQKENKTLQALYTHVISHIRVELERKVKDLMEGFQCKVCDQVFKAKAPLLTHIGCTHGKVNDILREKGYNVLPCLLATNGKKGAEMQANLVQIKKEKANILAE